MKSWVLAALLVSVVIAVAQAVEPGCYWSGTAPVCHGSCKTGEIVMGSSHVGEGATCVTGKKKLCCKQNVSSSTTSTTTTTPAPSTPAPATPALVPVGSDCYWSGTAPFCEGSCKAGEIVKDSNATGDGTTCLTGKKELCCKTT